MSWHLVLRSFFFCRCFLRVCWVALDVAALLVASSSFASLTVAKILLLFVSFFFFFFCCPFLFSLAQLLCIFFFLVSVPSSQWLGFLPRFCRFDSSIRGFASMQAAKLMGENTPESTYRKCLATRSQSGSFSYPQGGILQVVKYQG